MAPQKLLRRLVELPRDFYDTVHENKNFLNRLFTNNDANTDYQDRTCSMFEEAGR